MWLPVLFPSMAVMFALAGSLVAASLARRPGKHWQVLRKRVRRLLPPLWLYGAVLVALMIWQGWTVTRAEGSRLDWHAALAWLVPLEQPGGSVWGDELVLPLWYIRTYLWLLLLSPALYWLFRRHPRLVLGAPLALLGVLELRIVPVTAATGDTLSHLGMFSTCWLVGFAHHDGSLARLRRGRTVLLGLALMALGLAWALTHQLPETHWDIDEIPLADALYGLGAVLILLRLYPRRPVLAAVPWLAGAVAAMNARAMTVYLWGNAAIAAATPVIESNRWTRDLSAPTWRGLVAQYTVTWLIVVVIVLAFGWVEDVAAGRPPRLNPWPRRNPPAPRPGPVPRHWTPARSNTILAVLAAAGDGPARGRRPRDRRAGRAALYGRRGRPAARHHRRPVLSGPHARTGERLPDRRTRAGSGRRRAEPPLRLGPELGGPFRRLRRLRLRRRHLPLGHGGTDPAGLVPSWPGAEGEPVLRGPALQRPRRPRPRRRGPMGA